METLKGLQVFFLGADHALFLDHKELVYSRADKVTVVLSGRRRRNVGSRRRCWLGETHLKKGGREEDFN